MVAEYAEEIMVERNDSRATGYSSTLAAQTLEGVDVGPMEKLTYGCVSG